jgi:hypothetical protein
MKNISLLTTASLSYDMLEEEVTEVRTIVEPLIGKKFYLDSMNDSSIARFYEDVMTVD